MIENKFTHTMGMALAGETMQMTIDLTSLLVDLSQAPKEPEPIMTVGDELLFTEGNISTIGGVQKSRKTFLISLLISQFLEENEATVLLIDTEQSLFHVHRVTKRIHRLLGWQTDLCNSKLKVLALRELSVKERINTLEQSIAVWQPKLVFVDGIRDLVKDFNSPEESSDMVNLLMKLSSKYDCHICSVLHENKIGGQLRGHLGTELLNKSETVIGVKTEDNITTVSPLATRNKPFETFYFTVNDIGLPELCKPIEKPKSSNKLKALFEEALPAAVSLSYSDLRTKVMNMTGKTQRTVEKQIKAALDESILTKTDTGLYYCNSTNPPTEDEPLPF